MFVASPKIVYNRAVAYNRLCIVSNRVFRTTQKHKYKLYYTTYADVRRLVNMGKFLLNIPEELHNKLRHESINQKKDIQDIIVDTIQKEMK